jgi:hypothetical protein
VVKWEYCQIFWVEQKITEAERERLEASPLHPRIIKDESERFVLAELGYVKFFNDPDTSRAIQDLGSTLVELGSEGWELVSHTEVQLPSKRQVFYLKRPIE